MQQILGHIVPTMEHLEQERQQLAACITSVKALSLHEQSAQAKAAAKLLLLQQQQRQFYRAAAVGCWAGAAAGGVDDEEAGALQ